MDDLRGEYQHKYWIYNQDDIKKKQAEYRKTPEGKLALRRAKERQLLKKVKEICKGSPFCKNCNEERFNVLTIVEDEVLCYNCKYERKIVLTEDEINC